MRVSGHARVQLEHYSKDECEAVESTRPEKHSCEHLMVVCASRIAVAKLCVYALVSFSVSDVTSVDRPTMGLGNAVRV